MLAGPQRQHYNYTKKNVKEGVFLLHHYDVFSLYLIHNHLFSCFFLTIYIIISSSISIIISQAAFYVWKILYVYKFIYSLIYL